MEIDMDMDTDKDTETDTNIDCYRFCNSLYCSSTPIVKICLPAISMLLEN
jgi:hypothetical protein